MLICDVLSGNKLFVIQLPNNYDLKSMIILYMFNNTKPILGEWTCTLIMHTVLTSTLTFFGQGTETINSYKPFLKHHAFPGNLKKFGTIRTRQTV